MIYKLKKIFISIVYDTNPASWNNLLVNLVSQFVMPADTPIDASKFQKWLQAAGMYHSYTITIKRF